MVTIDGPAAAGKSTTARAVASALGFLYVDTGALYRALALKGLESGVRLENPEALAALLDSTRVDLSGTPDAVHVWLDGADVGERIRTPEVSEASSRMAAFPAVRARLVELQRSLASHGALVAEGRDLGTVVYPDAEVKLYLDADLPTRARRRARELESRGIPMSLEQVTEELERRDQRDRTRPDSPLQAATGAIVLDTSGWSIEQQIERVLDIVRGHPSRPESGPEERAAGGSQGVGASENT
ncbi:MAG: (d)CMP kinase [Candidatus Eisenbacteria bacterium]|nr:(d)CMP kinase [Candidatus Eisenbacteria bacterium]